MFSFFGDFVSLLYPDICRACGNSMVKGEEVICLSCIMHLPRTNFHLDPINPVIKHFWGKVPVEAATAYYYFNKGEKVQQLIHALKYKGKPEVGHKIGRMLGIDLQASALYKNVETIVPVPLHINKIRIRGYNQSEQIAIGLADAYKTTCSNLLQRRRHTETQTRKHRFERFENVNRVFEVINADLLINKHILLVDDVITTGSTLVSCAEELLKVKGVRVSIAAMAYAAR